jgi:hypothetical protein
MVQGKPKSAMVRFLASNLSSQDPTLSRRVRKSPELAGLPDPILLLNYKPQLTDSDKNKKSVYRIYSARPRKSPNREQGKLRTIELCHN